MYVAVIDYCLSLLPVTHILICRVDRYQIIMDQTSVSLRQKNGSLCVQNDSVNVTVKI